MKFSRTAILAFGAIALSAAAPVPPADTAIDGVLAGFDHDEHPDLRGVVVLREGRVVAERYYNGEAPDTVLSV